MLGRLVVPDDSDSMEELLPRAIFVRILDGKNHPIASVIGQWHSHFWLCAASLALKWDRTGKSACGTEAHIQSPTSQLSVMGAFLFEPL